MAGSKWVFERSELLGSWESEKESYEVFRGQFQRECGKSGDEGLMIVARGARKLSVFIPYGVAMKLGSVLIEGERVREGKVSHE